MTKEGGDLPFVFEVHSDPDAPHYKPPGPHRTVDDSRAVLEAWLAHWSSNGMLPAVSVAPIVTVCPT